MSPCNNLKKFTSSWIHLNLIWTTSPFPPFSHEPRWYCYLSYKKSILWNFLFQKLPYNTACATWPSSKNYDWGSWLWDFVVVYVNTSTSRPLHWKLKQDTSLFSLFGWTKRSYFSGHHFGTSPRSCSLINGQWPENKV